MDIDHHATGGGMPAPAYIAQIEQVMLSMPQTRVGIDHTLHGGMYARTALIPAGTAVTGALSSKDNICIVSGDITVTTDDGPQRITGFKVLAAEKGSKRIGIAHADTWWTAIIQTDANDIESAEDDMTVESARLQSRMMQLDHDPVQLAQADYLVFLDESGIPQEFVDAAMACTSDLIVTDSCLASMEIRESAIDGVGVFATVALIAGDVIAPARHSGKRCVAGRRTNHSNSPNALFFHVGNGDLMMVAISDIGVGEEITVDYRQALAIARRGGL